MSATAARRDPYKPAARVAGQRQDVWSIVNEAAAKTDVTPVVNMGQGFFGYNPPQFVLDAAKNALDRVECNQYSPTKGRPRLKKALSDAYSPFFGKTLNPETEITITTGANEGMLSAFMAFIEPGDEVIVFEPFFDQYISNIEMPGGKVVYVPMHPPKEGATKTTSAAEWKIDLNEFEAAITPKTRMIVLNTPHNPIGKVFSKEELQAIGDICVKHNLIILSDEVYDRLYYVPFTRIGTLSPELAERTITVGSGGKNFYATGWRVGWLIGPEHSIPEGGYFVLVNMSKVKLPENYDFPPHVAERPRDFKLSWFLIKEFGLAAIPPTEFFTPENAHIVEDWLRFAVCKEDHVLELAQDRLRGLKKYIHYGVCS